MEDIESPTHAGSTASRTGSINSHVHLKDHQFQEQAAARVSAYTYTPIPVYDPSGRKNPEISTNTSVP
jgi:hypothetical protein